MNKRGKERKERRERRGVIFGSFEEVEVFLLFLSFSRERESGLLESIARPFSRISLLSFLSLSPFLLRFFPSLCFSEIWILLWKRPPRRGFTKSR